MAEEGNLSSGAARGAQPSGSEQLAFTVDFSEETTSQWRLRRALSAGKGILKEHRWLLPLLGSVFGVILAMISLPVGWLPGPDEWNLTVSGVRNGLLTVLSIVFAGLSIVLAVASVTTQNVVGRYSLRMLRIYQRESWDASVVAAFAMAAAYTVAEQFQLFALAPDARAPIGGTVVGLLLLVFSGSTMIWYISSISNWFRVDHVVDGISQLTLRTAHNYVRTHQDSEPISRSVFERPPEALALPAPNSGFLVDVNTAALFDLAQRYQIEVVIDRGIGRSVVRGESIGWVRADGSLSVSSRAPFRLMPLRLSSRRIKIDDFKPPFSCPTNRVCPA